MKKIKYVIVAIVAAVIVLAGLSYVGCFGGAWRYPRDYNSPRAKNILYAVPQIVYVEELLNRSREKQDLGGNKNGWFDLKIAPDSVVEVPYRELDDRLNWAHYLGGDLLFTELLLGCF